MARLTCCVLLWVAAIAATCTHAEERQRHALPPQTAGAHWRVRDAAADSPFLLPDSRGDVLALQLRVVSHRFSAGASVAGSACTVTDTTGTERAVTLAYCVPLDATGWAWWDDPEGRRIIVGDKPFANLVEWYHGFPVNASLYPLAVLSSGDAGLCVAVPVEPPRMVRFLYDPAERELRAEFDFGLSPIPERFPSRADARVLAYTVPGQWAFRQALARYYRLCPKAFARRTKTGGIWMPFQSLAAIEKPEDFGIAFREVAYGDWDTVAVDGQYGVNSYVYVEPHTDWRHFQGDGERTYENFLAQLESAAQNGDRKAQATLVSAVQREDGRNDLYLADIPWTSAAPWGVNADPDVPRDGWDGWPNKGQFELEQLAGALGWRERPSVGIDGVYIDSTEGWGVMQNYRKAHWRSTRYPLTFHQETHRICLHNFWGTYAFMSDLAAQLRAKDMLLMANDVFYQLWEFAPLVDIAGREYRWIDNGAWNPVPDERFLFLRAMVAQRPYVLLMNNEYDKGEFMEAYFQRSLFYACYPSMFHGHTGASRPYFSNPEWYNRDRPLFLKYVPLIRKLDLAGWEPVPYANLQPSTIRVERYGDTRTHDLALALHNPTDIAVTVRVVLLRGPLHLPKRICATEWITGETVAVKTRGDVLEFQRSLAAQGYAVVGFRRVNALRRQACVK